MARETKRIRLQRPKISLFGFLALVMCILLLIVAIYERRRADAIEANAILVSSPQYKLVIAEELEILKKEIQLERAKNTFRSRMGLKGAEPLGSVEFRREAANIRNSGLKIGREKARVAGMKADLVRQALLLGDPQE